MRHKFRTQELFLLTGAEGRLNCLTRFSRRFLRAEDGALIVFGAFAFLMILMVAGIGVDLMRFERDRTTLQATLDRAVLAAADLDQKQDPNFVVNDYFAKAGLAEDLTSVTVEETVGSRTVFATANTEVWTQFMHMTGIDVLDAPAVGAAMEAIPNTEISLVLDISGSMRYNSRMETLKPVAKQFITDVLTADEADATSINVIPYAGQTNPGPIMFDYLGGRRFGLSDGDHFPEWGVDVSNITIWFDQNGDGVLDEENDFSAKIEGYPETEIGGLNKDDLDTYYEYAIDYVRRLEPSLSDATPAVGAMIKGGSEPTTFYSTTGEVLEAPATYTHTDLTIMFDDFYSEVVRNDLSSCIEMASADFTHSMLPAGNDQVPHFMKWAIDGTVMDWGWCPDDDTAIQYAQDDEATLHAFIDNIRMHDGTGTFYAMKYALALLDPASQPAFAHLESFGMVPAKFKTRPAAWDTPEWAKIIVLMTDGQITDQFRPTNALDPINRESELQFRPAEDGYMYTPRSTNLSRFYDQCDLAKSKGIVIFTIAYEAPASAVTEMRNCASSPSHFFEVTGAELADTFESIASSITKLRLTQ